MKYEKKYQEALERMKSWAKGEHPECFSEAQKTAEFIFPELREDDDDRVRKGLIKAVSRIFEGHKLFDTDVTREEALAWLEKQGEKQGKSALKAWKDMRLEVYQQASGNRHESNYSDDTTKMFSLNDIDEIIEKISEQKLADKVEPKFKVGDFIINDYCLGKVIVITNDAYLLDTGQGIPFSCENAHLWTIQDAKDGDVLATENFIFIFKNIDDGNGVHYYCQYEISKHENDNQFDIALPQSLMGRVGNSISHYSPATKEQRDLLFQKMKEVGYEWDSEKKELKKIEVANKESEDERIRKEILNVFNQLDEGTTICGRNYDYAKWIAWLEKQREEEYTLKSFRDKDVHKFMQYIEKQAKAYEFNLPNRGYDIYAFAKDILHWLEKRSEQKSTLPKVWKYKKDNIPLLRDSLILNKYGCVGKSPSGAIVSDVWVLDYDELAKLPKEELEKQGEQMTKPKFKLRDWIVDDVGNYWRVVKVQPNYYEIVGDDGVKSIPTRKYVDEKYHLWTIDDAKKGDILVVDGIWIVEFDKKMTNGCPWNDTSILTSFEYDMDDDICTTGSHMFYKEIWPASKEDIDLFKKKRNDHLASNSHNESKFKVGDKVTIEGDDTIYTIHSIDLGEYCWLTHEGRGRGWATFGVLKHYVE